MEEADAHECLSALLDAMHEGSLAGLKVKPPPQELANTFVHRIFGGLTKSEVRLTRSCVWDRIGCTSL